jgi:predicted transcriptional regulator
MAVMLSKMLKPCKTCSGTGKMVDDAQVGTHLRGIRTKAGISLRDMAKRLGCTPPYVSDLENGRRAWNQKRIDEFLQAVFK